MSLLPPINPPPSWQFDGEWRIAIAPAYDEAAFRTFLCQSLSENVKDAPFLIPPGRHALRRVALPFRDGTLDVIVKTFGRQARWRDALAMRYGAKAGRAFSTALHLTNAGVGTPPPVAALEKWKHNRLVESHFITMFMPELTDLRAELNRLYAEAPLCSDIMDLLQQSAEAIRAMHEAGVIHRDLGNQNVALKPALDNKKWAVLFLDLNRARRLPVPLPLDVCGRDLARLDIPSDFLRVFKAMYFHGKPPPPEFDDAEKKARRAFRRHTRTRKWRHPIRQRKIRQQEAGKPKPPIGRDIWVWDDRSAQAISVYARKDRHKLLAPYNTRLVAKTVAAKAIPIWRHFQKLRTESFQAPVDFSNRIGIALEPDPATWPTQLALLRQLQEPAGNLNVPILLRLYHHETPQQWQWTLDEAKKLHAAGHTISLALVQDRKAILNEERWAEMVHLAIRQGGPFVDSFEIGHAVNRSKWGIWDYREYRRLLAPLRSFHSVENRIRITGPACIDFEHHILAAFLAQQPHDLPFSALSHHLYVDRRGAPENQQSGFDVVDKIALTRACARAFPKATADRLVLSEVNWPILGTGVWSPVNSPYEVLAPRTHDPSVTEEQYAMYMARYLLLALASGHVERVYWWRLMARGFGLVDDTQPDAPRPRPAFTMLQTLLQAVGNAEFVERLPAADGAYELRFRQSDGTEIRAHWTLDSAPVFRTMKDSR